MSHALATTAFAALAWMLACESASLLGWFIDTHSVTPAAHLTQLMGSVSFWGSSLRQEGTGQLELRLTQLPL